MNWLYISLSVIAGIFVISLIVRKRIHAVNKKELREHPDHYCKRLKSNIEQESPKMKVKFLQELFELAANGTNSAMVELWHLLDNYQLSSVHHNIIKLLSQLGTAAVEAHTSTYYIDDKGTMYVAGTEGMEMVYTHAGKTGLKYAENLLNRKDIKDYNRNFHLHLLNIIGSLGNLDNALKLLKNFIPYGKNDGWVSTRRTILEIAKRHPLPANDQLLFDYIWALDNFISSNSGSYRHSQSYGGTHEEIEKKIQAKLSKVQKIQDSIDVCYEKARNMISSNEKLAVEFFREKMSKYLDYG